MDHRQDKPKDSELDLEPQVNTFSWTELIDRAFTGWEPADQTLERIIDRMERRS